MDIEANIKSLERRHQELSRDFKAGKIDEATFTAEVDRLQFQDSWGRYWMLGAQSGMWHYYDGQAWQQADPRQADRLPFMDDQGRYWQRGVKSGDWYYYQSSTGEWIKPGESDPMATPSMGWEQARSQSSTYVPDQTQLQPQNVEAGPGMPGQLDGQLFQDDEGRYWAIGEKSGQWYFYDRDGWHPAHEFGSGSALPQPHSQPYQPQPDQPATGYGYPGQQTAPHQPYSAAAGSAGQPGTGSMPVQSYVIQSPTPSSPSQPIQIYITSPSQDMHSGSGQSASHHAAQPQQSSPDMATPAESGQSDRKEAVSPAETLAGVSGESAPSEAKAVEPGVGQMPNPPKDRSESGKWFYYDGQQWLKYSSSEAEVADETGSPPPGAAIKQQPKAAKAEPKSEPVVAELFEEDEEPAVEVVDVEVITVIEPEPEPKPEPRPEPKATPPPTPAQESIPTSASQPTVDEVPPRRTSQPTEVPRRQQELDQTAARSRKGSTPEPGRPTPPRKRESAQEPTIIIPTGAAASSISARGGTPTKGSRPVKPAPAQQRRARENTLPMKPERRAEPAPPAEKHRSMTQPMPVVTGAAARRSDSAPVKPTKAPAQTAQEKAEAVATPATKVAEAQPEKEGFTLGDVFRSIPSTVWTAIGGVAILLACAVGLIFTWSWLQGDDLGADGLVAVPSLTPTLDAGPPDATPTPGPTPSAAPDIDVTATSASLALFSSEDLGYSVEYPENWEQTEDDLCGVFSPSTGGLDPDSLTDAAMWICKSAEDDAAISDILTEVLASFPSDAETLNEGTISIASQVWTSAQVRFVDEDLGGQGIATLAVTNKDKVGYYLVAVAPSETWNAVQPQFQRMINSFSFSTEAVARANTPASSPSTAGEEDEEDTSSGAASTRQSTSQASSTPRSTPTPKGTATPLVYSIQSGDTLLEIAQQFGVTVDLLVSKNDIDDPESLQIGQELIIPFTAEELEAYNEGRTVASTDASDTEAELEADADAATPAGSGADSASEQAADTTAAPAEEEEEASSEAAPLSGRIVYAGYNPGTNVYDLWMADVATGEQTIIATEASQPAFNKDGSLLAYRSWNLGNRGIFFRDFIGGREGLVTRFVEDGLPAWSSDGFSFVFASRREGDRVPRIYVGNQQGGDYGVGFQGEYADTFPDGRMIVKGCSPSGDCGMYVMGGTGGGETKITGEGSDTAPGVSPNGNKIAFMSSGRGATNWEIWVMNADGSNPQRLTENGSNDGLPTWSPDGQSIAYVSDQGGVWAIWAMNADGSNQRKLFNMKGSPDGQVLRDIDNSKGWLEERISWAP